MPQACLRPRDRFWDIPVPKIYHEVEDTLVHRKPMIRRHCNPA
ncbi:hypothetical protein [Thiolapillus sp.]